MMKVEKKITSL